MLVRGVVHHHIHEDANVSLLGFGYESVKISESAILWVDVLVVGDVVTKIDLWGGIDGRKPDSIDTKRLQIIESLSDSVEIANAIAI